MEFFAHAGSAIEETANAMKTYLLPSGVAPGEYDVRRNPDLARTYQMIAAGGRDAFYDGPIAQTIDAYFKRIGGWLSAEDLREHQAEWVEPLVTKYRGVDVYGMPANTQGLATLQMLNIIENFDMRGYGFQSAQSLQVQIEAKRLAYEDRARYYADPHFAKIPIAWLNSKEYAKERAKLIRLNAINEHVSPGQAPSHGDTTYFTTADKDGMMVSIIQSNFRGMGSGLVADGLGFMFQDRGQLFSLQDGHPNIYAPGKRPFQTIIPGFASKDGVPWLSFGVMGGDMQPQGQTQIILNRVDYGLDVQIGGRQSALAPRRIVAVDGRGPAGHGAARVAAIGSGRSGRDAQGARRSGLADGRERRRIRALRVHRVAQAGRGSRVCGGQRDALRRGGAGLLEHCSAGVLEHLRSTHETFSGALIRGSP